MADLGLYNYITNALAQGKSKEAIEAELAKGRVSPEAAEEAFAAVAKGENPNPYAVQPRKGNGGVLFSSLVVLIIVVGVTAGCYFFFVSPQLQKMELLPTTLFSTTSAPATSAASSTASNQDPFTEETAIKSDVDTIIEIALNYQDANGGINGQDINESCSQALSSSASAFSDPKVQSALKDILANNSPEQTCKIYGGGDGLAVSAQLVVDGTKWYCHDSDGHAMITAGDTLSSSSGGCQ